MNLTGDPWVPVAFASGESRLVSLVDAFNRGEEISDLVATPPQRVALTRLLVCIAQAALDGPTDEADWHSCRNRIAPASVAYLEDNKKCFELFGDRAFLQAPNIAPTDNATLDKLGFGLAAGNNAVLFDHEASSNGRAQSAVWSALALVTYQCFSPGGTIGSSTWSRVTTSRNSEHAPCVEGSMLHTIVRGESLLATVHMNLLTKEVARRAGNPDWGKPVWEQMPTAPGDPIIVELTTSYLGRLVPVSRGIKLHAGSTKTTLVNACSYPKLPHREPAATVVRRGKDEKLAYLGVDLSKHPWRELASVLSSSHSLLEGGAWILGHLAPGQGHVDLWTGGLAANKGKVLDVAEWNFNLPLSLWGEPPLNKYRQGVQLADSGSASLRAAVGEYFKDLALSEFSRTDQRSREQRKKILTKAAALYWRTLDSSYGVLVDTANDPTRDLTGAWYGIVRGAMERAYERACARQSARQIRAYAKGYQRLRLRKPGRQDTGLHKETRGVRSVEWTMERRNRKTRSSGSSIN